MSVVHTIDNAFVPMQRTDPEGIKWLQVVADPDIYEHFKRLPKVVKCDGIMYQKMSFNSDSFLIWYKEVSEKDIAFPINLT